MTKTQAVSKLNQVVYYLPEDLPSEITWQTLIPSGTLAEITESKRKDESVVTSGWGVVNHNTFGLDELYMTAKVAQVALKQRYLDEAAFAEIAAVNHAALAEAVDTIGIDPNPPEPEPEP